MNIMHMKEYLLLFKENWFQLVLLFDPNTHLILNLTLNPNHEDTLILKKNSEF